MRALPGLHCRTQKVVRFRRRGAANNGTAWPCRLSGSGQCVSCGLTRVSHACQNCAVTGQDTELASTATPPIVVAIASVISAKMARARPNGNAGSEGKSLTARILFHGPVAPGKQRRFLTYARGQNSPSADKVINQQQTAGNFFVASFIMPAPSPQNPPVWRNLLTGCRFFGRLATIAVIFCDSQAIILRHSTIYRFYVRILYAQCRISGLSDS